MPATPLTSTTNRDINADDHFIHGSDSLKFKSRSKNKRTLIDITEPSTTFDQKVVITEQVRDGDHPLLKRPMIEIRDRNDFVMSVINTKGMEVYGYGGVYGKEDAMVNDAGYRPDDRFRLLNPEGSLYLTGPLHISQFTRLPEDPANPIVTKKFMIDAETGDVVIGGTLHVEGGITFSEDRFFRDYTHINPINGNIEFDAQEGDGDVDEGDDEDEGGGADGDEDGGGGGAGGDRARGNFQLGGLSITPLGKIITTQPIGLVTDSGDVKFNINAAGDITDVNEIHAKDISTLSLTSGTIENTGGLITRSITMSDPELNSSVNIDRNGIATFSNTVNTGALNINNGNTWLWGDGSVSHAGPMYVPNISIGNGNITLNETGDGVFAGSVNATSFGSVNANSVNVSSSDGTVNLDGSGHITLTGSVNANSVNVENQCTLSSTGDGVFTGGITANEVNVNGGNCYLGPTGDGIFGLSVNAPTIYTSDGGCILGSYGNAFFTGTVHAQELDLNSGSITFSQSGSASFNGAVTTPSISGVNSINNDTISFQPLGAVSIANSLSVNNDTVTLDSSGLTLTTPINVSTFVPPTLPTHIGYSFSTSNTSALILNNGTVNYVCCTLPIPCPGVWSIHGYFYITGTSNTIQSAIVLGTSFTIGAVYSTAPDDWLVRSNAGTAVGAINTRMVTATDSTTVVALILNASVNNASLPVGKASLRATRLA